MSVISSTLAIPRYRWVGCLASIIRLQHIPKQRMLGFCSLDLSWVPWLYMDLRDLYLKSMRLCQPSQATISPRPGSYLPFSSHHGSQIPAWWRCHLCEGCTAPQQGKLGRWGAGKGEALYSVLLWSGYLWPSEGKKREKKRIRTAPRVGVGGVQQPRSLLHGYNIATQRKLINFH